MLKVMRPVSAGPGMSPLSPRTQPSFGLRLWRIVASPWCTLLLLILLAPAGAFSVLLPQGDSAPLAMQGRWLATLQGRYGRWTELLSDLGLFDVSHALWLQVLLALLAFQGLVAAADGCTQAWKWVRRTGQRLPRLPPAHAWQEEVMLLASPLTEAATEVGLAFRRLGYRVCVDEGEGDALLEAIRHPWLTLGRPLAQAGVALICVAGLVGGRLDWQEGPVLLSAGQVHELRHVPGVILRVKKVGLARGSLELHSWVSLLRGEQVLCGGVIPSDRELGCEGMSVRQGRAEPALRIAGYDPAGHPLALERTEAEEVSVEGVVLPLPSYSSHRSVALGQGRLWLRIEASSDEARPLFRVEVYRVEKSAPLIQREITGTTSLVLDDLTLVLSPMRVPSFWIRHCPTRALGWCGLSLVLFGLLLSLVLLPFHRWARVGEQEGGSWVRVWPGYPLPLRVSAIRELESQMRSPFTRGTLT